jgi:adenylate cyclase
MGRSVDCSNCGAANRTEAKFCVECGTPLALSCPNGHPVPPGARFCDECGAPVQGTQPAATTASRPLGPTAERRLVSVLFADLVGFTSLSEGRDSEDVRELLGRYFDTARRLVALYGGTIEKFIGDAVMAVWGNVSSRGVAEDAKSCARSALAMRRALQTLNAKWKLEGIAPFAIGIGINQGDVLGGNIGSQEKADPTVIGDAVNLASRLEALTRTYRVDILVGASASELIRDEFHLRSVALVQVKGKTKPVEIFALIGAKNEPGDDEFIQRLEIYETGFRKFRERDFIQAKILFSEFLKFYPDDALARMYFERTIEYEEEPPDGTWNAVEVFKKK